MAKPIRLERAPEDSGGISQTFGKARPTAIAWFGFSAFWGHLRHLVASAIATENIDSRQWMVPDDPSALLERVFVVLDAKDKDARTLATGMGGEVWIDFIADSGDDCSVSTAVGKLLFASYVVEDPDDEAKTLDLPRGDILIHGGDIAYPVATVREVTRRVVEPWNAILAKGDKKHRVLLGIPGNHDWYDGLDGFARLCQAPCDFEGPRDAGFPPSDIGDGSDRISVIEHPVLAWAEAFSRGVAVKKPGALTLEGFVPVQRASYFRIPLARGIDLFGVDRQLKQVDPRQRSYFGQKGAKARLVVVPDPVRSWGETRPNGAATVAALGLDLPKQPTFMLSGDIHHYERSKEGKSIHVVAGGGGAFLHGARSAPNPSYKILSEFPGPKASASLLWRLPLHTAIGRAGWLLSGALGLAVFIGMWLYVRYGWMAMMSSATTVTILIAISTALLVGWRGRRAHRVIPFALANGVMIGITPLVLSTGVERMGTALTGAHGSIVALPFLTAVLLGTLSSGFAFGAMLTIIARLGLNHAQPFAALGLPGYRHFLRLRVRETAEKSIVDVFVIGAVDPLGPPDGGGKPVLVDTFRWAP